MILVYLVATLLFADRGKIESADLLFQDLDCGPMCDAIEEVTQGHNGHHFSHVAIALDAKNAVEAIGKEVSIVKIADFLQRTLDKNQKPKVAVGKIPFLSKEDRQRILKYTLGKLKTPYDDVFSLGEEKLYCSELVYFAYQKDKPLFTLNKMTFKKPGENNFYPVWVNYFKNLKVIIPEGELGINPGSISRDRQVIMTYPFGEISRQ